MLVSVEYAVGEVVLSEELPDILDGVELWRVGRQVKEADVGREAQPATGLMPSGAVEDDDGMAVGCDVAGDLDEMQVHGVGIGMRQDEGGTDVAVGADGAEEIGPLVALVARCRWA